MDAKTVTIIHALKGEIEVKEKLAENYLTYNHVSKGGSYCRVEEAYLYFEEYAPKPEENPKAPPAKKRGRRKKATTTTSETAANENKEV